MSPWRPVNVPLGGLSEGSASSEQPAGTYQDGLNLRSIDPRTGQRRLSSREGLVRVGGESVAGAGDRVTSIHRVGERRPLETWSRLSTTPDATLTPSAVTEEWTAGAGEEALALAVHDGLVYALLGEGQVAILNEQGEEQGRYDLPSPFGFELVPRVAVDFNGEVWVAYRQGRVIDGGASRMYRMFEASDDDWQVRVELVVEGEVQDFDVSGTSLAVVEHAASTEEESAVATLRLFGAATSSVPEESWSRSVAFPVAMTRIGTDGSIYVACPASAERSGGQADGITPSSWTPREGYNVGPGQDYLPEFQLVWGVSAQRASTFQAFSDGASVSTWESALYDESDFEDVRAEPVRDYLERSGTTPPTFDATALNGLPGIRFDGTQALQSPLSSGRDVRTQSDPRGLTFRTSFPGPDTTRPLVGSPGTTDVTKNMTILFSPDDVVGADQFVWSEGEFAVMCSTNGSGGCSVRVVVRDTGAAIAGMTDLGNGRHAVVSGTVDVEAVVVSIYFVSGGTSEIRVNGAAIFSGTLPTSVSTTNRQSILGSSLSRYDGSTAIVPFSGVIYEQWTSEGALPGFSLSVGALPLDTVERFEAYMTYGYGVQSILDAAHTYFAAPPASIGDSEREPDLGLNEQQGVLAKIAPSSRVRWVEVGETYGSGLAVGSDGQVFSIGANLGSTASTAQVRGRKAIDEGASLRITGNDTFTLSLEEQEILDPVPVRILWDGADGAFFFLATRDASTTDLRELRYLVPDGAGGATLVFTFAPAAGTIPYAVRVGRQLLESRQEGVDGPEAIVVLVDEGDPIRRLGVLGKAPTGAVSTRRISVFATAESGDVARREVGTTEDWSIQASGSLPGTRPWAATVFPFTVFGDGGDDYRIYDSRSQQLRNFSTETSGTVPARCEVGVSWRSRLILGVGDEGGQIFFSEFGDVTDFRDGGENVTAETAVVASLARARQFPDVVRGMLAWNDDLLFVFCDGSVWRVTGDPATGGQMDQVQDAVGIADSWARCTDPEGRIYYLGTDGHVWVMLPNGQRQSITESRIRRRLETLDLTSFRVEFQWDVANDGLWIVFIPRSTAVEGVRHLFWQRELNAWHPVLFEGGRGRCVTAIGTTDGDSPTDRALLLGFADGSILRTDKDARDDAGVAKRYRALLGPLLPRGSHRDVRIGAVQVATAIDSEVSMLGARSSPTFDSLGPLAGARTVRGGRGPGVPVRTRGTAVWLDWSGEGNAALEDLDVQVAAGRRKLPGSRRTV